MDLPPLRGFGENVVDNLHLQNIFFDFDFLGIRFSILVSGRKNCLIEGTNAILQEHQFENNCYE